VVSDALGETAEQVSRAALTQFGDGVFRVVRAPRMTTVRQLQDWAYTKCRETPCVVVYTLATPELRAEMDRLIEGGVVRGVDVMGETVGLLADVSGRDPAWRSGGTLRAGRGSLAWFEALEFAFRHDDGKHPEELTHADVVLIGASRTSKTPLSMYLAFRGHAVANVPLMADVEPPPELFDVERRKVFGLMTEPDLLVRIRAKRAAEMGSFGGTYASRDAVERDLTAARRVMRRIGCTLVWTGDRAIEEAAQEIIREIDAEQ
jgi:regulator of PEP synthase PpsR (kinase-PPPase family)